jgi:hypothetical protein
VYKVQDTLVFAQHHQTPSTRERLSVSRTMTVP